MKECGFKIIAKIKDNISEDDKIRVKRRNRTFKKFAQHNTAR